MWTPSSACLHCACREVCTLIAAWCRKQGCDSCPIPVQCHCQHGAKLSQLPVQVVDAAAPGNPLYGKGFVATNANPTSLVWAPVASATLIYDR